MPFRVVNANQTRQVPNFLLLTEDPIINATYSIAPRSYKTIVKFGEPLQVNTGITFDVDSTRSVIGDELVLIIENGSTNSIDIDTDTPFYVWQCGDRDTSVSIPSGIGQRIVMYLVYDGTFWTYTGDNC